MARSRSPCIWWRYASLQSPIARSSRPSPIGSDGPGLPPVAHLPEHPLVAARRDEVAPHRLALSGRARRGGGLGRVEDAAHDVAELRRGVRGDPAGVEGVGRTRAL